MWFNFIIMKLFKYFLLSSVVIVLSCGGQQSNHINFDDNNDVNKDSVYTISPYTLNDNVMVRGTRYNYLCDFHADASLDVVTSSFGDKYYDNVLDLTITKDGEAVFSHQFTKQSFASHINDNELSDYALLGFNFNYMKADDHNQFHFIASVGDPDESGTVVKSFDIDITTAGAITITTAAGAEEDSYGLQDEGV